MIDISETRRAWGASLYPFKPHLRLVPKYPLRGWWECRGRGYVGVGRTPALAYDAWNPWIQRRLPGGGVGA